MKKMFLMFMMIFSSAIFSQEKIKEVGKVVYEKESQSFIFYFLKDSKVRSVIIKPSDKGQLNLLRKFENKTIVLEGEIQPYLKTGEGIVYREEINNPSMKDIGDELYKIDTKKILEQHQMVGNHKFEKIQTSEKGIAVSNKATNTIIGVAGVVVGVAVGPIALVPVAVYLINEKLSK